MSQRHLPTSEGITVVKSIISKPPQPGDYKVAALTVDVTQPLSFTVPFSRPGSFDELVARFVEHRDYWLTVASRRLDLARNPGPYTAEILEDAKEALSFAAYFSPGQTLKI